jgi:hypothetical protein
MNGRGTALACSALPARDYLRHGFASLLPHEGKLSIVELASQLGHSPTITLNTYGHVMRELGEAPRVSAAEQIQLARESFRGSAVFGITPAVASRLVPWCRSGR